MKQLFLSLTIGLVSLATYAQNKGIYTSRVYPQDYFRNPLNIPLDASGTFGELRSTHFHAGDDYRTQQKIGLPLHAAAEGFVSRVRVQIGGGGNSVYIDHPNGFTTVYLHMDAFNEDLSTIIRTEQYKQKRFDVDVTVPANQVKLTKGQFIGRAGNTGASGGPHLHFEIRDTKSQKPLNAQLFGLRFTDKFAPTINGIMVYDLGESLFNENTPRRPQKLKTVRAGHYQLATNSPILVNGKFGLGINSIDRHRAGGFQNGVYSIDLFIDAQPISTVIFEELDFNTSRGIHSYIDYPYWKKTKSKYQKSFKDPGNRIEIFKHLDNSGIIEFKDDKVHEIKYVVKDIQGNCSELDFTVKNAPSYQPQRNSIQGELFAYNKINSFTAENLKLTMPIGVLYGDLDFVYRASAPTSNAYSPIHHISNELTPLFTTYQLSIKPINLPTHLESKALIASVQSGSEGGTFENGWVTVNTRNLGSFYITVDTVAPSITARNLVQGKNIAAQKKIDFTISDNFSGIKSFDGYIDGEWVLMEYDSKNRHLWHTFDTNLTKGSHQFKLSVKDWKDNERVYEASFLK